MKEPSLGDLKQILVAEALKNGIKIRRPNWKEGHYWLVKEGRIIDSSGKQINDWEEYKEPASTLTDRVIMTDEGVCIKVRDVVNFVQEYFSSTAPVAFSKWCLDNKMEKDVHSYFYFCKITKNRILGRIFD